MTASETRKREAARDHGTPPSVLRRRGTVLVVDGFGVSLRVERGRLIVSDGSGSERRERSFDRTGTPIARVVVLGGTGSLALSALCWLADRGVPLLALDREGRQLCVSVPPASGDARLRRAQALAAANETGLLVAHYTLGEKLAGQERVLRLLTSDPKTLGSFADAVSWLERAESIDELVAAEREAARLYWGAWASVPVRFRAGDLERVPEHWSSFGTRHSRLTNSPRLATNPANAVLNFLYRMLEAETGIACLASGLDPMLGIVHADYRDRDSLALDLMEVVRPEVDRYLLELLSSRTFRARDFYETRKGVCRLLPPLTHELASTTTEWARLIAPVCERVAQMLAKAPGSKIDRVSTPLTSANRISGHAQATRCQSQLELLRAPKLAPACKRCGGPVPRSDRSYCDECLPAVRHEQRGRRACKRCGGEVPHRKRVYCDKCFTDLRREQSAQRAARVCKRCGDVVPNRKRVYCDPCFEAVQFGAARADCAAVRHFSTDCRTSGAARSET